MFVSANRLVTNAIHYLPSSKIFEALTLRASAAERSCRARRSMLPIVDRSSYIYIFPIVGKLLQKQSTKQFHRSVGYRRHLRATSSRLTDHAHTSQHAQRQSGCCLAVDRDSNGTIFLAVAD